MIKPRTTINKIPVWCAHDKTVNCSELIPNPKNPNTHPEKQIELLGKIILEQGWRAPITVSKRSGFIVKGHGRLEAALKVGILKTPVDYQDYESEALEHADMIADNRLAELAEIDDDKLSDLLSELKDFDIDMDLTGFDIDIIDNKETKQPNLLVDNFIVPPFSIFDTKKGYWIERKRMWMEKIGDCGESRKNTLSDVKIPKGYHSGKGLTHVSANASLLDPVLSEIINLWFCVKNAKTFDCFAGDTVFGFVSSFYGNIFTGIELRKEQVELNQKRCDANNLSTTYICDDGRNINKYINPHSQDLFFSCPPYYNLEIYSDKKSDASNQKTYLSFYKIINTAFTKAIDCLKDNRFAVIVCGDIRNTKTGAYYDFLGDIKKTFKENGLMLYNEIIIAERIGTACMKAANYMKNRKIVKTHQSALVFYKGDSKKIKDNFPILNEINEKRIRSIESEYVE